MRVTAKAQRSDGWWAVEVPEVPGVFTQARRLDQIPEMVADAVALVAGVAVADVEVDVEPITDLDEAVAEARDARRAADEANTRASESIRATLKLLLTMGYTVRDAGQLLGISPQRVSQLAGSTPTASKAARSKTTTVVESGRSRTRVYKEKPAGTTRVYGEKSAAAKAKRV